jgi:FtsH-binding integral membrane protein
MEEMKTGSQKIFENLTKEERKLLLREFNKGVGFRYKIFRWSGIGLLFPAIISGGFSIYYMINILFAQIVPFQLYICAAVFTLGCIGSMLLTRQYYNRFLIWFGERKKHYHPPRKP